jgi:hypothetical protein
MDHLFLELLKAFLRGLAWLGENFPDDPRLGRKMLLIGGLLVSSVLLPTTSSEWGDLILTLQLLCVLSGGVCFLLSAFVFFRRWVWRRQDKRAPVITTLLQK